jgi:hypothetical protein
VRLEPFVSWAFKDGSRTVKKNEPAKRLPLWLIIDALIIAFTIGFFCFWSEPRELIQK